MKTIISRILIIFMIIILCIGGVYKCNANEKKESYKLNLRDGEAILKYTNYELRNSYVYYEIEENGIKKEYPAYCLNKFLPGVEKYKDKDYIVSPDRLVSDSTIWTVITNGYPYKSIEEMGCKSKEEAYTATLQSIYCILYLQDENNFSNYSALNESGERVLSAMKKIVDKARNNTQSKSSTWVDIICDDNMWKADSVDDNYAYKEYHIGNTIIKDEYIVQLGSGYPNGTLITDLDNNVKSTFKKGEHFKVIVPANEMKKTGSFYVKVDAKLRTLPVYDASTGNQNQQNYALTHELYEDGHGEVLEKYKSDASQITIIKRDNETKKRLEGAEFNILDSNKKVIHAGLITNSNGETKVKNLEAGFYYIEETKAPSGYHKIKEPIRFELKYNQELTISVNNTVEKHTEESTTTTGNITITDKYEENIKNSEHYEEIIENNEKNNINNQLTHVKKEYNTITNNTNNTQNEDSIEVNNKNISNRIESKQKNMETINVSTKNIKELPKTGM